ncbi:uncharacterized protein LOC115748390 [Rhodamnia argentea]|uniref:Uncharacterized protein LOC115748390 n=1 Tax=Rhodamnia argentea TaxID=178133 RepID=A0A8B8Q2H1_9MYRT|nr:uncharacterized protein LOC115748390 [Rhodamnia argentea]
MAKSGIGDTRRSRSRGRSLRRKSKPPLVQHEGENGRVPAGPSRPVTDRQVGRNRSRSTMQGKQQMQPQTWASVAKVMAKGYNLSYVAPLIEDGEPIVDITPEIVANQNPMLRESIVGYFLGKKIFFKITEEAIKKAWGAHVMDVRMHENGFYFTHIPDETFRRKVLDMGPITILRSTMMLQPWHPKLKLKKPANDTLPVWIRMRDIPLSLWSPQGISRIASAIGNPLYVDVQTEQMKRLSFARVCIEIKASRPRVQVIKLRWDDELITIGVEYEWNPLSCDACGIFGHKLGATGYPCASEHGPPNDKPSAPDPRPQLEGTWQQVQGRKGRRNAGPKLPLPDDSSVPQLAQLRLDSDHDVNPEKTGHTSPGLKTANMDPPLRAPSPVPGLCRPSNLQGESQPLPPAESPRASSTHSSTSENGGDTGTNKGIDAKDDISTPSPPFTRARATGGALAEDHDLIIQPNAAPKEPDIPRREDSPTSSKTGLKSKKKKAKKKYWGLVNPLKQAEIRSLVRINRLSCIGILETKVKQSRFESISSGLLSGWRWTSNYDYSSRGRIWIGWNPRDVDILVLLTHARLIHVHLNYITMNKSCYLSVAYGEHTFVARRALWADLIRLGGGEDPWMVAGDFNAIRDHTDRMGSSNAWIPAFDEFGDCLTHAGLDDLRYVGHRFTWATSSGDSRKQRKIDRVLINEHWSRVFSFSEAAFLAPGISDHTPMVVKIVPPPVSKRPFKFFNYWTSHPSYKDIVTRAWSTPVGGSPMYKVCCKLGLLKARLKQLNTSSFSDISNRTEQARLALFSIQDALERDPTNRSLVDRELEHLRAFSELRLREESFYKRKSRIRWLKEGDHNTRYFHHFVNKRHHRNRILSVLDSTGVVLTEPNLVREHIVGHFQQLLNGDSTSTCTGISDIRGYIGRTLDDDQINSLSRHVTDEEIRCTFSSLARGKAPGPDGFNVEFFTTSWETVGPSVILAVKDFFSTGCLLKETNTTILSLVPKTPNASAMGEFRPIACCNTVYKCITKIIANRIASVLPSIVNSSQTAFVKGRRISDNILLAQELFANFHHQPYLPKCAIKVDFQKAYDTMDWSFLEMVLQAFRFPSFLVRLIMECISSPRFSVAINGELHGFFSKNAGIRQGDPLSPYLFTLVMEVFSGILRAKTNLPDFKYFRRCKSSRLSHLFFVDDVLLFTEAHIGSVRLLKEGLDIFSGWSGLKPNRNKSNIFFSGGTSSLHDQIRECLGFQQGTLPFRYLGVPIIASRLSKTHCKVLVDSITARVRSWAQRFLSYAGRLQLIKSVLHSIHVYWASIFTLPRSILHDIERILRRFLWKGPNLGVGGAKVSRADICLPKDEGGLGIRRLVDYNKAMTLKHIWTLFTDKESLWCKWIHSTFPKNTNFWVATKPTFCSWTWKKILDLRVDFSSQFRWKLRNGRTTAFWYDWWHDKGPLFGLFSSRDIYRSRIPHEATVRSFYDSDWPPSDSRNTILGWAEPAPSFNDNGDDILTWQAHPSGTFSVASAWDFIESKGRAAPWHSFVWDRDITPRHAFLMWLVTLNRIPTRTLLIQNRRITDGTCAFCRRRPDSVDHLFFGCSVTGSLALFWAAKCRLTWRNRPWQEHIRWAMTYIGGRSFSHRLAGFSHGALCHLIWTKRNDILFRSKALFVPEMIKHLIKVVKDKAISLGTVNDTPWNRRLQSSWGLSPAIFEARP